MKITKNDLKRIILEVLTEGTEGEEETMQTAGLGAHATAQKKAMAQGGIDDKERAAIATISQKLALAAKKGSLLSGTIARRLQQLVADIDKALGSSGSSDQPQQVQPQQGEQG